MSRKSLVRRVQNLECQWNPPNHVFVWKDWDGQYSINGEKMGEAAYQRWCEQQKPNTVVCIFAWRHGDDYAERAKRRAI